MDVELDKLGSKRKADTASDVISKPAAVGSQLHGVGKGGAPCRIITSTSSVQQLALLTVIQTNSWPC